MTRLNNEQVRDRFQTDLAEIYRAHASFVWRSTRRLGVTASDVPDLVHDIFIVAFERLSTYDAHKASFRAWLYGVTRYVVLNRKRKEKNRRRIFKKVIESEPPPATPSTPDRTYFEKELKLLAKDALMRLPEKQRSVFILVDLEGQSIDDAAQVLEVNRNTAWGRLRAARASLNLAVTEGRAAIHEKADEMLCDFSVFKSPIDLRAGSGEMR